ncbi:MAG TPA: beta-ketoacyl synthase N-terminal-like domain-containing protein [Kineosporiaceae bacterium]|nr:beta-ketoacyl synthase N-terminal-like domain-containing protein [Kineosporiaceae bacterium]
MTTGSGSMSHARTATASAQVPHLSADTTPAAAVSPLVVSGCGVLSAAGPGLRSLGDPAAGGSTSGPAEAGAGLLAPDTDDLPPVPVAPIHDLRTDALGRKGLASLDRTTILALLACHQALGGLSGELSAQDRLRTGVAVGTSTGSIRSSSEFSRDTLVQEKPYLVRASLFPNSVMNCCASQVALRNGLRGVNATLAGGRLSSHAAFRYARNAIVQGHADRVLVGGVEELCPQTLWGWHRSEALAPGVKVGEGAAIFVLEPPESAANAGRSPLAEILACELASSAGRGNAQAVVAAGVATVRRALERSRTSAEEITTVVPGTTGVVGLEAVETAILNRVLGRRTIRRIDPVTMAGETFSAGGAFQLAAWLARPGDRADTALIISLDQDGAVACLVARRTP